MKRRLFCLVTVLAISSWTSATERLFVLPIELETDRGAANGDATMLRVMPAYNWRISESWQVVNLDLLLLANAPGGVPGWPGNPEPIPGNRARGMSDWIHASFFNQVGDGTGFVVGAGFMASLPLATDPALGSGKWAAGPALRIVWRQGPWTVGAFGGQRWSFAGKPERADISQLMVRGTIRRQIGSRWYFVSAPIITANWNSASGERWLVPLGGGFGRRFMLGGNDWGASIQFYDNVLKPEGAPDWSVRLALTTVIPF
jgi:hypothetical protein